MNGCIWTEHIKYFSELYMAQWRVHTAFHKENRPFQIVSPLSLLTLKGTSPAKYPKPTAKYWIVCGEVRTAYDKVWTAYSETKNCLRSSTVHPIYGNVRPAYGKVRTVFGKKKTACGEVPSYGQLTVVRTAYGEIRTAYSEINKFSLRRSTKLRIAYCGTDSLWRNTDSLQRNK